MQPRPPARPHVPVQDAAVPAPERMASRPGRNAPDEKGPFVLPPSGPEGLHNPVFRSEDFVGRILASSPDCIQVLDLSGRLLYLNESGQRLLGITDLASRLHSQWIDWWDDEFRAAAAGAVAAARAGETARVEGVATGEDGAKKWWDVAVTPLTGPDGAICWLLVFSRDLTAHRAAEAELRATQARLGLAVEAADLGVFHCPMPLGEIIWNEKCKAHFWLEPDAEVDFDLFYSLLHPADRERTRRCVERAIAHRSPYDVEYRTVSPDGQRTRWIRAIGRAFYGPDGTPIRFDGVTVDVTPQKQAAENLRGREAQLQALSRQLQFLDELAEGTRDLTDPERVMTVVAERLGRHLGVSRCAYGDVEPQELRVNIRHDYANGCQSVVGAYSAAAFGPEIVGRLLAGETCVAADVTQDFPSAAPACREVDVAAFICCPLIKGGHWTALLAVQQTAARRWTEDEVTLVEAVADRSWAYVERARANREVVESEQRFRSLVAATTPVVWQAGVDGVVTGDLPGWELFTGQTRDEYLGLGWLGAVHPDDRETVRALWGGPAGVESRVETVCRLRRRDGEYRRVCATGVPLVHDDGTLREWVGSWSDLEDKLRYDERREELLKVERTARSEAERASRMKDEFLSTLSHELRTPLNAILGWAQVLRAGASGPDELSRGLNAIDRNARAQTQIIEDLLDMGRIVSGKVRLEIGPTDLAAVVEAATDTVRPAAEAKGIRLEVAIETPRHTFNADPERLQQVLWNLLSNAVKFTPANGWVRVALRRVDGCLQVSVADTGEGIGPEFLPHVFDRFRQADGSTTRRHGGLGLGLAIVKQLVELHGGTVRVESEGRNRGTTFTVILPVADLDAPAAAVLAVREVSAGETEPATVAEGPSWDLGGVRVLVVDADADARALVTRVLRDHAATVREVTGAAEAWQAFQGAPPDVLVSDVDLPGEDGYSLLRRVRSLGPGRGGDTPAVALTTGVRPGDRLQTLRGGFQQHVAKPVEADELLAVVASLAGRL